MSVHPDLAMTVYVGDSIVFALVLLYWFGYTRRTMKTPRNVGTSEGIAMATQRKHRAGRAGTTR
ncbi:MAG: hypothetical protein NVS9B15_09590 [Acidobacteriaceae bacterium]